MFEESVAFFKHVSCAVQVPHVKLHVSYLVASVLAVSQ